MRTTIATFVFVSALVLISTAFAGAIRLPATGQTSCYDSGGTVIPCAGTGQDGELRTGAAWPSPRFTDNGDQTMSDTLTGLVWSRDANPAATAGTWQGALDYVKGLNDAAYLGYSDWRLPNRRQLMSLINRGQANNATWLNTQGFAGVKSSYYWSSSSYASITSNAWYVGMDSGYVGNYSKAGSYYVWPVRAGQILSFGHFYTSSGNGAYPVTTVGATARYTFAFVNQDATSRSIATATIAGANAADFTIVNDTCANRTIAAGDACTLDVIFVPSAAGSRAATLTIASGSDMVQILLSGSGSTDIRGTVTDLSTGLPLAGATVVLAGGGSVTTDNFGAFSFSPAYGTYDVTVSKNGYNTYTATGITTSATQGALLKLGIAPAGILNITSAAPLLPTRPFFDLIKVIGGTGPYTFSLAYGSLPSGVTLDPALGTITGKPTTAGSRTFAIGVIDSLGAYAEQEYTVNFPVISTTSYLPRAKQNSVYAATIAAQGGVAPVTFGATGLPPGLALNSNSGVISGTPSAVGTFSFTVTATDGVGRSYQKIFRMYVEAPMTITTGSLANGAFGSAYNQTVAGSGGYPPYTWNLASGTLPPGLSLDTATGAISGTPSASGTWNFTIGLTDHSGATVTKSLGITVPVFAITTDKLHNVIAGNAYNQTLTTTSGVAPYTWSLSSGALPTGLALDPAGGTISGTPASAGSRQIVIAVQDSTGRTATSPYTLTITGPLTLVTAAMPNGLVNEPYAEYLRVSGGVGPFSFALTGQLPAGLSLNSATGLISGTPTAVGLTNAAVSVTDSSWPTPQTINSIPFSTRIWSMATITTPASLTGIHTGQTMTPVTLTAKAGAAPYTWNLQSGSMPSGVTLSAGGVISGTPAAPGSYTFTIRATDSVGTPAIADKLFYLTVSDPVQITTLNLPFGSAGVPYSHPLTAVNAVAPSTWSITSGALPPGITLDGVSGVLGGTTPYCGYFPVVVQVTDSAVPAMAVSAGYTLNISCSPGYSLTGSVSINNGAQDTFSSAVNLAIAVANNVLGRQMRFSTDNATWSGWETFATGKSMNLAAGLGTRYVYVQVKDAADNVATFSDSITVRTIYPLTITLAGTGGGNVNGGMACVTGGSCPPQNFDEGTPVTLTPSADSNSTFGGWSSACVVSGIDCIVTMNGPKTVTATFTAADKVRIGAVPYTTLTAAFAQAATGVIKARAIEFGESLVILQPTVFEGGWNSSFGSNGGSFTTMDGTLRIRGGKLTVRGLAIR